MCVCVCVYVCAYVCICGCVYVCVHLWVCGYVGVYDDIIIVVIGYRLVVMYQKMVIIFSVLVLERVELGLNCQ